MRRDEFCTRETTFALSNVTPRKRGRAGAVWLQRNTFGLSLSKALFSPLPSWERARVRVMPRRRREQLLESLSKGSLTPDGTL